MKGEKELKIQRLVRSQAENRLSIFDNKSDLIEREVRLPTLMYAPGTPKKQSPWAVVDLGSTLDRLSGAANTCLLVKVSPQLAGPRVLLCASACKMLQGGPGAGGGVWTIIRQKGRPVTPLTSAEVVRTLGGHLVVLLVEQPALGYTLRNAGRLSCHHAVVFPPPSPSFSNAWIYVGARPSACTVSIKCLSGKTMSGLFASTGRPK